MPRVALTKKEQATEAGRSLVALLKEITLDGEVDDHEIAVLRKWLDHNTGEGILPAVAWLRELIHAILADGKVTRSERNELLLAMERVLPPEDRVLARVRRQTAVRKRREQEQARAEGRWERHAASERQLDYLVKLGVDHDPRGLTKGQASELITAHLEQNPDVSNRQRMVLRFWDKEHLAKKGRGKVSQWMDDWYLADPRHLEAWERWKVDVGDTGGQSDPRVVPLGEGFRYLRSSHDLASDATPPPLPSAGLRRLRQVISRILKNIAIGLLALIILTLAGILVHNLANPG